MYFYVYELYNMLGGILVLSVCVAQPRVTDAELG